MMYDRKRAAEMVLALMYLDLHDGARAWKGYPWDVLNFLFDGGLITDPARKAKSVVLTDEGVAEATRCFNDLLATEPPVADQAKPAAAGTGELSDVQRAQVDALLSAVCQLPPDPAIAAAVRRGYQVDGTAVVLFESQPSFLNPDHWQERPVAKFRFNKSRATWRLYCMFRDLKWHVYEALPESPDLSELVRRVKSDPTGIFWG